MKKFGMFLATFVALLLAIGTVSASDPYNDEYTVALYHFEEGSGNTLIDTSGNGFHGTLVNSPTWTDGRFGKGLHFNGINQYVSFPTTFGTYRNTTYEIWFKLDEPITPELDSRIGLMGQHFYFWQREQHIDISWRPYANGKLIFRIDCHPGSPYGDPAHSIYSLSDTWEADRWYHGTFIWGEGGMAMYLDGVLQGTDSFNGVNMNDVFFTIGSTGLNEWLLAPFHGTLDLFRVSNIQRIPVLDSDGDGIPDDEDNCPTIANPDQAEYSINWQPPLSNEDRTFNLGSTIPIKFGVYDSNDQTIRDETVIVSAYDPGNETVFQAFYGEGDDNVRIDSEGFYITNFHTSGLSEGTYRVVLSFEGDNPCKYDTEMSISLEEMPVEVTPPAISKPLDSDGDTWTDEYERKVGTNPFKPDTDGDGYWDFEDPNPLDPNIPIPTTSVPATTSLPQTPIPTATPFKTEEPKITSAPPATTPPSTGEAILDSDGDGWSDEEEIEAGTDPENKDTDGDGWWDSKDPNPLDSSIPEKLKEDIQRQSGLIQQLIEVFKKAFGRFFK